MLLLVLASVACTDPTAASGKDVDAPDSAVDSGADSAAPLDTACELRTWYRDEDADRYGIPGDTLQACEQPVGYVGISTDCDDADQTIYPEATEIIADGVDDDCDGVDSCYHDEDGDSFGGGVAIDSGNLTCDGLGYSYVSTDCDDGDAAISPAATEVPGNAVDEDCDSRVE